jgi:hypothetical protein
MHAYTVYLYYSCLGSLLCHSCLVNLQFCINPVNLFGQTWSSPRISCVFIIAAKHLVEYEVVLGFL